MKYDLGLHVKGGERRLHSPADESSQFIINYLSCLSRLLPQVEELHTPFFCLFHSLLILNPTPALGYTAFVLLLAVGNFHLKESQGFSEAQKKNIIVQVKNFPFF